MPTTNQEYKYLGLREGSSYRQYFVKGTKFRAAFLYGDTLEPDALTPEEVAEDYGVPVEAVYEAIDYCKRNMALLHEESEREKESIRARGWDKPPFAPPEYQADS